MQVKTKAIVLSQVKYGESSLIVRLFTESDGLKSYMLKGVRASKRGRIKPAYFLPFNLLEIEATHKNKGTLEHLREVRLSQQKPALHQDIVRSSLVLFLAEVVGQSVVEDQEDQELFAFLEGAINQLEKTRELRVFHLYFIKELGRYLGIMPEVGEEVLPYFDLLEGRFLDRPGLNPIAEPPISSQFAVLLGIHFDALSKWKINKVERTELLKCLLLYFELHLHGFQKPRSLEVLQAVFD